MPGAESRPPSKGGENKGNDARKGRRRYFRRKGDEAQATEPEREAAPPARIAGQSARAVDRNAAADKRTRSNRRRRRSKGKRLDGESQPLPAVDVAADVNYVPPASVYIYTHVVRPDTRESYEFRSEHFSSVGRRLEDYDIDLSSLFDEEGKVKTLRIPEEALRLLRDLENEEESDVAGDSDAPPPSTATAT
jgi:hypothetical protein